MALLGNFLFFSLHPFFSCYHSEETDGVIEARFLRSNEKANWGGVMHARERTQSGRKIIMSDAGIGKRNARSHFGLCLFLLLFYY